MENPTVSGLRSRSRSKTPFLRSSCDHENCTEGEEHTHVSGRKTPIRKSSKQPKASKTVELIEEEDEARASPSAHRTRQSVRMEKILKTSDYSSDENPKEYRKEMLQSTQYEAVSSNTRRHETLTDVSLSPIHNVTHDRSTRYGSPTFSNSSTSSTFAEQILVDAKALLAKDPTLDHLPSRLYKMAGEYWNKYPKTDFTYSRFSKDRVELAPGQVAMPNMSRRALGTFHTGSSFSGHDETDRLSSTTAWSTSQIRKRFYTAADSSDDEYTYGNGAKHQQDRQWAKKYESSSYKNNNANYKYPYLAREKPNIFRRTATNAGAALYWIYTMITTVVTTTVTTVTETVSPSNIASTYRQITQSSRRKWPWLLLLLLPILGYGCYNYGEQLIPQERPNYVETHKTLEVVRDAEVIKKMEALENWALSVDSKLKDLDERIKSFTEHKFVTKDQMESFSESMYKRLFESLKSNVDEDRIRLILQEYLSVFEHRQMEIIMKMVTERVKEIEIRRETGGFDEDAVRKIVASMLDVYDADKIGMVDFALESAGGQVISTKCTELYQIKTKQYSVLGLPVWWVYTSPRHALTAGAMPADCWAFQAFPGYLVVRLYAIIEVTGFTIEHMSKLLAANGKIESAPKNFSVYGLHDELDQDPHLFGNYMYDANGTSNQFFPVQYQKTTNIGGKEYPVAFDIVELRVESNHGNPTYTCVYRFRVHGNPLTDIRSATEDSIRDSENT